MIREKKRYKLLNVDGLELGQSHSIQGIADLVGCTAIWIYKQKFVDNKFKYKKITYVLIDKLDEN
jgi:hypothetical protein